MEIAEQMRLGSLHKSLLTQSQQLMLRTPSQMQSQVQILTERNQDVLDRLGEREILLRSRLALWDNYMGDQERLMTWLRDMEREKQMLNLKHVAVKRIPRVLKKIENLLDRMPLGEKLFKDLVSQQNELQNNYDSNTISSIRIELHSLQERISSLRAGLRTWMDHLLRVQRLASECDEKENNALTEMDKPMEILALPIPRDEEAAQRDLRLCQTSTTNLEGLTPELEALNSLQEELKECVSPSDIKQTSQRAWLLWQKQADMKHQLALRMGQLESRSVLLDLFRTQNQRFIDWANRTVLRLEAKDISVQDQIYRFETDYKEEISAKEKEISWLCKVKDQLYLSLDSEKKEVDEAILMAKSRYNDLLQLYKTKLDKLKNILNTQEKLESDLRELNRLLTEIENKISESTKLTGIGLEEYKINLKSHCDLEKRINQNSERVSRVLNQGEILINDFDNSNTSSDISHIQNDISSIDSRWKTICLKTSERKMKNKETWEQWQLYLEEYKSLKKWIDKRITVVEFDVASINLSECKEKEKELDIIMSNINGNINTLDEFNSLFCLLAKEGKLDEGGELKEIHTSTLDDWENL